MFETVICQIFNVMCVSNCLYYQCDVSHVRTVSWSHKSHAHVTTNDNSLDFNLATLGINSWVTTLAVVKQLGKKACGERSLFGKQIMEPWQQHELQRSLLNYMLLLLLGFRFGNHFSILSCWSYHGWQCQVFVPSFDDRRELKFNWLW